ncbi:hypothetical protein OHV05_36745 (plasmid) [Kitasatospora sp. NBC_00070]|uniref:hypothetical protein n=1 Tax=Kitasatospora sp. NBC_00070 TaxID=2975962 RepID=UPI002F91270E
MGGNIADGDLPESFWTDLPGWCEGMNRRVFGEEGEAEDGRGRFHFIGGPLDGIRLGSAALRDAAVAGGYALESAGCTYRNGLSFYAPVPSRPGVLLWVVDIP